MRCSKSIGRFTKPEEDQENTQLNWRNNLFSKLKHEQIWL